MSSINPLAVGVAMTTRAVHLFGPAKTKHSKYRGAKTIPKTLPQVSLQQRPTTLPQHLCTLPCRANEKRYVVQRLRWLCWLRTQGTTHRNHTQGTAHTRNHIHKDPNTQGIKHIRNHTQIHELRNVSSMVSWGPWQTLEDTLSSIVSNFVSTMPSMPRGLSSLEWSASALLNLGQSVYTVTEGFTGIGSN